MTVAATVSPPRDLTIPEPGSQTARDLLSRAIGRLFKDLLALPRSLPPSPQIDELWGVIRTIAAGGASPAAAALLRALRSPTVSALIRAARNAVTPRGRAAGATQFTRAELDAIVIELAATLTFELALAGALGRELRVERLPPRILSLEARSDLRIGPGARGVFSDGELVIDRAGEVVTLDLAAIARGEPAPGVARPYHPITDAIELGTADNNPRARFGAEPGEPGNPVDLGGRPESEWTAMLRQCLDLIGEHCADLRGEIDLYIRQFVPAGYHGETHRSASYRESVGAIHMTLHPLPMTIAEAILHEFSHNKLHALLELDPILENDAGARFRSPVRPDPRPLRGVLLAVHAFLPVAFLYERMIEARHPFTKSGYFAERFAQIRSLNRDGAEVLFAHARPTPVGEAVLGEIRRWIDHYRD